MTLAGIVVYRGLYFGMYDTLKPSLPKEWRNNLFANFAVGYAVVTGASLRKC